MSHSVRAVLLIAIASFSRVFAQTIPNPGFESWTNGDPDGWITPNTSTFHPVTANPSSRHGNFACDMRVSVDGSNIVHMVMTSRTFLVHGAPLALHGWYQFIPTSLDTFHVELRHGAAGEVLAQWGTSAGSGNWKQFTATVAGSGNIDSATVAFSIEPSAGANAHAGSVLTLDDLSLDVVVGVAETGDVHPAGFALEPIAPNPARGTTVVVYNVPERAPVRVTVADMLGRTVAVLSNGDHDAGRYRAALDASALPAGMYRCLMQSAAGSWSRTLVVTH